ncbi:hypothetical protein [Micromonospora pisi]|uniref:hypothetical protein n=1 Tax=Micromonospora pisi TaxID=589240 RepID=UPI001FE7C7D2|nr:hypothetical protein [Micromonospora pisi]
MNRRFEQLRQAAGLEWLHLHDLRHAFATFLLDQGRSCGPSWNCWATPRSG